MEEGDSWSSWAWSYVPQILPTEEEGEEEEGEDQPRRKAAPPILVISLYISKASLLLKVSHIARVI